MAPGRKKAQNEKMNSLSESVMSESGVAKPGPQAGEQGEDCWERPVEPRWPPGVEIDSDYPPEEVLEALRSLPAPAVLVRVGKPFF